jgi:hypothetical protein
MITDRNVGYDWLNSWRAKCILSPCELSGIEFCSIFDIGSRPIHGRKRSTSEARFDLRCGEFSRSTGWADIILDGRRDFSPPLDVTLGGQLILLVTRNKR